MLRFFVCLSCWLVWLTLMSATKEWHWRIVVVFEWMKNCVLNSLEKLLENSFSFVLARSALWLVSFLFEMADFHWKFLASFGLFERRKRFAYKSIANQNSQARVPARRRIKRIELCDVEQQTIECGKNWRIFHDFIRFPRGFSHHPTAFDVSACLVSHLCGSGAGSSAVAYKS